MNTPSTIEAVTVFRRGALVSRAVRLDTLLPEVRVMNLPLAMDDASLRTRVEGDARVVDVRVLLEKPGLTAEALEPAHDEPLREAVSEEDLARSEVVALEVELARIHGSLLQPRPQSEEGTAPGESPTEARLALLAFQEAESVRLLAQLTQEKERARLASERRAELEEDHRRASSAREAREEELRKTAVLSLEGEGPATVFVDYLVPGACWAPAYSLRLDPDLRGGMLEARALIWQRTGEDWSKVRLSLSTAAPQSWCELPELKSLRIGRVQASVARRWRPPPVGTEALFADFERGFASEPGGAPSGHQHAATSGRIRIEILQGGQVITVQDFVGPVMNIGRVRGAELRLNDAKISRRHARISLSSDGRLQLEDLANTNGTRLNGRPIRKADLADGDEIELGVTVLRLRFSPEARRAALGPPERPAGALLPPAPQASAPARGLHTVGSEEITGELGALEENSYELSAGASPPAVAASASPRPVAPAQKKSAARSGRGRRGSVSNQQSTAEVKKDLPPPPVPVADDRLLNYAALRLPAPTARNRGQLRLVSHEERLVELSVSVRLYQAVTRAIEYAKDAPSPPTGHRLARTIRGFDYAYRAEHPADVPADGAYHSVPLQQMPAVCRPFYVCVPRETCDVFRLLDAQNPLQAPLLAGPVDVYVGPSYLLTAPLEDIPVGGRLEIGLGVEQAIEVTRNARFSEGSAGLLGGKLTLEHRIDVELCSHLQQPAEVEVRERVPIAGEEDSHVTVRIGPSTPAWERWEPDERPLRGGYRWCVSLPPSGETVTLSAEYEVEIPSKYALVGGNRREP